MVTDILYHVVELQTKVARDIERLEIVLKGYAAVFLAVPFQRIEDYKAESVDEPRLQTHLRRMILQRLPVMLHQIDGILVCQRKEVQVLFLMKLITLVENVITHLTVSVEIVTDNVSVASAEALQYLLIR